MKEADIIHKTFIEQSFARKKMRRLYSLIKQIKNTT